MREDWEGEAGATLVWKASGLNMSGREVLGESEEEKALELAGCQKFCGDCGPLGRRWGGWCSQRRRAGIDSRCQLGPRELWKVSGDSIGSARGV